MTDKVDAITERVTLDLMDHLDDLDRHGRSYIRDYVEAITGPKTTRRPHYRFHPKLAELVRELASEAALADRRPCGAARATGPDPLTPVGAVVISHSESSRKKVA